MTSEPLPPRRRFLAALSLGLAALPWTGCGEEAERPRFARRDIKFSELPPDVLTAAQKQLPEVRFDEAWTNVGPDGTLLSYEIRGKAAGGKIREVRVDTAGNILEME